MDQLCIAALLQGMVENQNVRNIMINLIKKELHILNNFLMVFVLIINLEK